jgi:hypothetical protein
MYLNNFSVRIPEGKETSGGYVDMQHNTQYRLVLRNSRSIRCDARVEVDGKHVGTWRIPANQSITLERPVHDESKFTFYKLGTSEGNQAQLNGSNPSLGLVKVTFTPEVKRDVVYKENRIWVDGKEVFPGASGWSYTASLCAAPQAKGATRSAGGTGLSGHSNQTFYDAEYLDLDYSQQTVIHLRLVCNDIDAPRPLTSFSTPVPPPVR